MSGKKITYNPPATKPKRPIAERVVSERGRKELPPGTKGGENLKPDRHYEHKQYAFDSYCKKVLKCEACNGYRQISRRQKRFTSLEELSEAEMAQLAVYDCYPWEYTTFPVGGAVGCGSRNGAGIHQRHAGDLTLAGLGAFAVGEIAGGVADAELAIGRGITCAEAGAAEAFAEDAARGNDIGGRCSYHTVLAAAAYNQECGGRRYPLQACRTRGPRQSQEQVCL